MMPCQTSLLLTVRVLGRGKEGRRKGEEGRKEGELVTPLKYNSVCRSAADGGWSEPVH